MNKRDFILSNFVIDKRQILRFLRRIRIYHLRKEWIILFLKKSKTISGMHI